MEVSLACETSEELQLTEGVSEWKYIDFITTTVTAEKKKARVMGENVTLEL
jgi:hypothetical protein